MRVSDFDLLIVPGLRGGNGDWTSRWQAKLSTASFVRPANPAERRREAWIEAIAEAARDKTRPVLLVGHGLGATAITDAASTINGASVCGAFLVAPPDRMGLGRLASEDWGLSRMRLPWPSIVVASRNDPDGAYEAVAALASDWGADLIDAGYAGSIDAASGHGPWPEGLMRLAGFLKRLSAATDQGDTPSR
jgi:predicted alpha/beta hydrolase family esterase